MAGATTWSARAGDDGRPTDRRRERGERTRTGILDAAIDLIDGGNPRPTVRQVARRAGVSERLVYHHFGRLEVVIGLAAERQAERHRALVAPVPPRGPLPARIATICRRRRQLFEATGAVLQVAEARQLDTPRVREVLHRQRLRLRHQLEVVFGPEVHDRDDDAEHILELLEYTTGWRHWSALRHEVGLSATAAERSMVSAVADLLHRGPR